MKLAGTAEKEREGERGGREGGDGERGKGRLVY